MTVRESIGGKAGKKAGRYLLEALLLAGIVYLIYALAGIRELLTWTYGVRTFLTGTAVFFLAALSAGKSFLTAFRGVPTALFLLYALPFSLVSSAAAGAVGIRAEAASPCFQMALGLAALLFLSLETGRRFRAARIPAGIFSFLLLFAACVNLLVYLTYYILYGAPFSQDTMTVILLTNAQEASEFLLSRLGAAGTAGAAAFLLLYAWLCVRYIQREFRRGARETGKLRRGALLLQALVFLCGCLLLNHWCVRTFPGLEYRHARKYIDSMSQLSGQHEESLSRLALTAEQGTLPHALPGTVIAVIGETANRDHMKAFNPAYPSETTPWLSAQKEGFYLFPKAYSNYPITVTALFNYLTNMNQYNGKTEGDIVTITDIANRAGYRTYWLSNQDKDTSVVPLLASASAEEHWTSPLMGDDRNLLTLLKKVPRDGSNFIVIHLWGSHDRYRDRVPDGFPRFDYGEERQRAADYDTSIRYTDEVLKEIFEYASENLNLQAMTYCSDHGEDMAHTHHGGSGFTYDMIRVPLFIYLSPAYQAAFPETAANLAAHRDDVFTNDLMFDTICGLLRAPNSEYDPRYDLTSAEYDLPLEKAVTEQGAVRIADDPALKNRAK